MSLLRSLFGPSKDDMWRSLAQEVEGRFREGKWSTSSAVQVREKDWIITLDTYTVSTGSVTVVYTRMRAPFVNPDAFRFTIYRAGLFSELGKKLLGTQDIEIGDPSFDRDFIIKGNSADLVRELFAGERIRELIRSQPSIHLMVADDEGRFGTQFPKGVDELRFHVTGVIKDLKPLKHLFELFSEVLHRLCHLGSAYEDDTGILIQTLLGPGGTIEKGGVVRWEGDPPRHRAAEALGRTSDPEAVDALTAVLTDPDTTLVVTAVRALRRIENPRAIPMLIPLLGDRRPKGSRVLAVDAQEALVGLGAEPLTQAFDRALAGEVDPLKKTVGEHRPAFAKAFMAALDSPDLTESVKAAEALGELGAVEALPALRAKLREHRSWELGRETCRQVIADLEALASLPRPAEAQEADPGSLPRPADEPGPDTDSLPRALEDESQTRS